MQRYAYPQAAHVPPVHGKEGTLGLQRGRNRSRGSRKGGLNRVANGLEVDAAMRLDGRIEQGKMALDRGSHRLAVPLPERGAALDVGEEKGDGPAWQLGHAAISGPF